MIGAVVNIWIDFCRHKITDYCEEVYHSYQE